MKLLLVCQMISCDFQVSLKMIVVLKTILENATSPFQDVWDKSLFELKCNKKNKKFPIFTFTPYPNIYTALCM